MYSRTFLRAYELIDFFKTLNSLFVLKQICSVDYSGIRLNFSKDNLSNSTFNCFELSIVLSKFHFNQQISIAFRVPKTEPYIDN